MRRLSRLERPALQTPSRIPSATPFLCAACRQHTASFSTSRRIAAPKKEPLTEKIRKKIWGTDSPPGQADPYGSPSIFEQARAARERDAPKARTDVEASVPELELDNDIEADSQANFDDGFDVYEPATTWDGLEEIGGRGNWWGEGSIAPQFEGFLPGEKVNDPYELTAALHRTIVEVFTLKQAGRPLSDLSTAGVGEDVTSEVQIVPSRSNTGAELSFSDNATQDTILQALESSIPNSNPTESEADVDADRSPLDPLQPEVPAVDETIEKGSPTESEEDVAADRSVEDPLKEEEKLLKAMENDAQVRSWDRIWLTVSLEDLDVKFAVIKRVMQLTGVRIPDSRINSITTVGELLNTLATPPKPQKVVEALAQKADLFQLPNVKIYQRRITPIDRERSVGRWKLIERELERRELPVTGHSV